MTESDSSFNVSPPTSPAGRPMINADTEGARLRELERLGIAVDQPDQSLQEVVNRVAEIYGVDLCTVNLILGDRQVFKAWAGNLPPEMAALRWIERQKGLCTYVVASNTPLVIDDMQASDEWREQLSRGHRVEQLAELLRTIA